MLAPDGLPLLSKSRYVKGLHCVRLLWLTCFKPELAEPSSTSQFARMDTGTKVGLLARERFPGGVLIAEDYKHMDEALESTRTALEAEASTLYEAAFLYNGIQIRADILHQVSEGLYDLIEVKSTSKPKDEHLHDLAIQLYVLEEAGISIRKTKLMHINTAYVWPGGPYDLHQLFTLADLTDEVRAEQAGFLENLNNLRSMLIPEQMPDIRTGRHCNTPDPCTFHAYCHQHEPEHPVRYLPRVRQDLLDKLELAGIQDIREIPADFSGINVQCTRIINSVKNGTPWFSDSLTSAFDDLRYPLCFIDFESFNPALPLFPGTRPYQQITFQWSAHILKADGTLSHYEYLHDGLGDPREAFTRNLVELLTGKGSVLVYSAFEKTQLNDLKNFLPAFTKAIDDIIGKLFDLLNVVRNHCYHPGFRGSFSIKKVLPALVPELGYDDLTIGDGGAASQAYAEMLEACTVERAEEIRQALLEYCGRDTLAMVALFKQLQKG
jgi:hypothetical protein